MVLQPPNGNAKCPAVGQSALSAGIWRPAPQITEQRSGPLCSGALMKPRLLFVFLCALLFAELPGAPSNLVISNISPRSVTISFRPGSDGKTAKSQWVVEGQVCVCGASVRPFRPSVPSVYSAIRPLQDCLREYPPVHS